MVVSELRAVVQDLGVLPSDVFTGIGAIYEGYLDVVVIRIWGLSIILVLHVGVHVQDKPTVRVVIVVKPLGVDISHVFEEIFAAVTECDGRLRDIVPKSESCRRNLVFSVVLARVQH